MKFYLRFRASLGVEIVDNGESTKYIITTSDEHFLCKHQNINIFQSKCVL